MACRPFPTAFPLNYTAALHVYGQHYVKHPSPTECEKLITQGVNYWRGEYILIKFAFH